MRHCSLWSPFDSLWKDGFQGVARSAALCHTRIFNTQDACESSAGAESKPSRFVSRQDMKVSQERFSFQPASIFKLPFHSNLTTLSKPLLF